jgi:hypothetical protein
VPSRGRLSWLPSRTRTGLVAHFAFKNFQCFYNFQTIDWQPVSNAQMKKNRKLFEQKQKKAVTATVNSGDEDKLKASNGMRFLDATP